MGNWISHDQDLGKHEKKGKLDTITRELFDTINGVHCRADRYKPATLSSRYVEREFELQKAKATMHRSIMQTRLI